MADRLSITGLWSRQTSKGTILSVKLSERTLMALRDAMEQYPDGEIVIFENSRRRSDKDPSHTMFFAAPYKRDESVPF